MPEAYNPPRPSYNGQQQRSYADAAKPPAKNNTSTLIDTDAELYKHLLLVQKQLEVLDRKIDTMDFTIKEHELRIQRLESYVKWDEAGVNNPELLTHNTTTTYTCTEESFEKPTNRSDTNVLMGWDNALSHSDSTNIHEQQSDIKLQQRNIQNTLNNIMTYLNPFNNAAGSSSSTSQ